jgi:hypothetical protein
MSNLIITKPNISEMWCVQVDQGERIKCDCTIPHCVNGYVTGDKKYTYPVNDVLTKCTKENLLNETQIPLTTAFGGTLSNKTPLYACVTSAGTIYSGLSSSNIIDALQMEHTCHLNNSTLQQISAPSCLTS